MKNKKLLNKKIILMLALIAVMVVALISGCSSDAETGEESGDGSGESGESGIYYALDETFDEVQSSARLILNYDAQTNTFTGTVENTTNNVLSQVRVEVHLDNGVELGPTTPTDLAPGQMIDVTFQATDTNFTTWTAHPEVGGEGSENGGEHGEGGG